MTDSTTESRVHTLGPSCTDGCLTRDYVLTFGSDGTWTIHAPHEHPDMRTVCGWGSPVLVTVAWLDIPDMDGDPRERICEDCFTESGIRLMVGAL